MAQPRTRRFNARAILRLLASNTFCRVIFILFIVEALWIALSGGYSMAYDEYFHLGIIKLYAHQWSPLLGHQPDGPAIYGAVARDPSYLYHYLMSFPYRVFAHFVSSTTAQVIFLRLIDIGLFTAGLVVFRKLFRLSGLSPLLSNLCLLFFVVLPVTPFLAAQINYDNLVFLMTATSVYLAVQLTNVIRDRDQLPLRRMFMLLSVLMLSSLVKYAFLPIALGIGIYLLLSIYREIGLRRLTLLPAIKRGARSLKNVRGILVCVLLIVSMGLFLERYAVNTVRYHTPTPECDVVLDVDTCRAYDPFNRNQNYKDANFKAAITHKDKATYPFTWLHSIIRSLFFSVGPKQLNYPGGEPLPLAYAAGYIAGVGGLIVLVWRARALWRQNHTYQLFMIVCVVYVVVLFLQNLSDFLGLGIPVAIQGRYMVPVLLLGFALVAVSARDILARLRVPRAAQLSVVAVLGVLMLQGGGITPFILRSSDEWMWPNSAAERVNHTVRNALWYEVYK